MARRAVPLLALLLLPAPAAALDQPPVAAGAIALDCSGVVAAAGAGLPGTRWSLAVRIDVAHVREPWSYELGAGGTGAAFAYHHVFTPMNFVWSAAGRATLAADGRVVAEASCTSLVSAA